MSFLNHTFAYEGLRDCTLITKNGAKIIVNIDSIEFSGDGFTKFEGHTMGVKTTEPRLSYTDYSRYYKMNDVEFNRHLNRIPEIKNVIFNDPATIVFWEDGSKTVVKCQDGDEFDPEKGLAMAIVKKAYGNKGSYCNKLKKWLPKEEVDTNSILRSAGQYLVSGLVDGINSNDIDKFSKSFKRNLMDAFNIIFEEEER